MPLDPLTKFLEDLRRWGAEKFGLYYGPYRAIVTSNKDPDARGRVQVECARARLVHGNNRWILPSTDGADKSNGLFWPPEEGTGVYIFFDNGNPTIPACYMGGWYATAEVHADLKPTANQSPAKRGMATKGGHRMVFDDTSGNTAFTITTPGGIQVSLSDKNDTILVQTKGGKVFQIAGGICKVGSSNGQFEPMMKGSTVKQWLITHQHPHAWGPTGAPIQPFPATGLSSDTQTS